MPRRAGEPADPRDDLTRELRKIAAGRAAQPLFIEPSAEERARRQRVTRSPPPGRVPRRPSRVNRVLGLLVIAAILGASLWLVILRNGTRAGPPGLAQGMSAPLADPDFTAVDPFAGTQAAGWADGAAGIMPPPSQAIGGFSVLQVRAAYRTTRRLLIAAHLNRRTLAGRRPAAFADLLAPQLRRSFLARLRTVRTWVTSFAPGTTELVGSVIKVHGSMRAMVALDRGRYVLRVHADYVFVYAVQRPGQPQTQTRVLAQDVVNVDFAPWNDPGGPLEAWWLPFGTGRHGGIRCGVRNGFVLPDFPGGMAERPEPTGACQVTTGTLGATRRPGLLRGQRSEPYRVKHGDSCASGCGAPLWRNCRAGEPGG